MGSYRRSDAHQDAAARVRTYRARSIPADSQRLADLSERATAWLVPDGDSKTKRRVGTAPRSHAPAWSRRATFRRACSVKTRHERSHFKQHVRLIGNKDVVRSANHFDHVGFRLDALKVADELL